MTDKKKNGWIKFVPSLDLPKERVSIAYDTHDERGVRYGYGYFQFHNGTCGCFWKDGNEQPKVVKAEDIKYWMPVPSLDVQEEPVSEELRKAARKYARERVADPDFPVYNDEYEVTCAFEDGAEWQQERFEKNRLKHCNSITNEQAELEQKFLDEHLDKHDRIPTFLDAIEYGMDLQKKLMMKGLCFETKVYLESDGCAEDFNESEWLDLEKTEITELPVDALGLKAGDKVMILIVKEG